MGLFGATVFLGEIKITVLDLQTKRKHIGSG